MKKSELVKKLNEISGIRVFSKDRISILDSTSECLAEVGIVGSWLHIYDNCPNEVSKLLVEYYSTPVEEREEEKKYWLSIPKEIKGFGDEVILNFVNYDEENPYYAICTKNEIIHNGNHKLYQTQFTQKEIDSMPRGFKEFFIKEEVK